MTKRFDTRRALIAATTVVALAAAACGDDTGVSDETPSASDGPSTSESTSSTTPAPAVSSTTGPETTTTTSVPSSSTSAPVTGPGDDELPGTVFELAPTAGRVLAVVGVRFDDVLNVRSAPGTDQAIVAELDPLAADFVASGRARMLTRSIWWEVTTSDGTLGWVNSSYTAQIGPTVDLTAQVVEVLGGLPEEETMTALGQVVADVLGPEDPDLLTDVVLTVEPSVGDLGEVTYDVVGLGDDAVRALRLHVFGQPLESGEGFVLKSVEATDMCESVRGVAEPDGLCA